MYGKIQIEFYEIHMRSVVVAVILVSVYCAVDQCNISWICNFYPVCQRLETKIELAFLEYISYLVRLYLNRFWRKLNYHVI